MSGARPEFTPASGSLSLERAIELARRGRPEMALLLISDALGAELADALVDLLAGRVRLATQYKGKFLPNEAEAIRLAYERLKKLHPRKGRDHLLAMLVERYAKEHNVAESTFGDIIDRKNTYRRTGEQSPKRSLHHPRK